MQYIYNSLHNNIPTNIHVPKYKYVHKVIIPVLVGRVTQLAFLRNCDVVMLVSS